MKNLLTIFNLHKMEMCSNAFLHSGSEIMLRSINSSSYSSLAKYLPLCVSSSHHHGNNSLDILFNRVNSFLKADKLFPDSDVLLLDSKYSDYPSNTCFPFLQKEYC